MVNNKQINEDAQIARMKQLMGYGLNESQQPIYSSVEYSKVAADGNLYGIVREGTSYFIKKANDPKGSLVKENFEYIGGFRNRKDNQFDSFASAQRYFGEKMIGINEEVGDKQKAVIAEAWDIDAAKEVVAEGTKKMQAEIARQRQIMENAMIIEAKGSCCDGKCKQEFKAVKGKDADKNAESPKSDAKKAEEKVKDYNGKAIKGGVGAPFTEGPGKVVESAETPLSSRKNPDFMDTSHGTEIGKVSGFGKEVADKTPNSVAEENGGEAENTETPENVNEGTSMHDSDNQNTPSVGTGEKGDTDPFDEKVTVTEAVDDIDDTLDDEEGEDFDDEDGEDFGEEDFGDEGDEDFSDEEDVEDEMGDEPIDDIDNSEVDNDVIESEDDTNARLDALESKLDTIIQSLQDMKYDDEPLYDAESDEEDDGLGNDIDNDDFGDEGEEDFDDEENEDFDDEEDEDEDTEVIESRSYRRMRQMNEDRLNYFGKHPAYQKKVMTLPPNTNPKRDGQYDMNDSSVDGEAPYGQKLGNNAPFSQSVEKIENEITEQVMRALKKKLQ